MHGVSAVDVMVLAVAATVCCLRQPSGLHEILACMGLIMVRQLVPTEPNACYCSMAGARVQRVACTEHVNVPQVMCCWIAGDDW